MDNKTRREVTAMIWVAALVGALTTQSPFADSTLTAVATAFFATIFLWWGVFAERLLGNRSAPKAQPSTSDIDSKAYKLAVLLEMMDEDERAEFKYQLKNDILSRDDSQLVESFISEKRKNR